jgi:hypothetical protein
MAAGVLRRSGGKSESPDVRILQGESNFVSQLSALRPKQGPPIAASVQRRDVLEYRTYSGIGKLGHRFWRFSRGAGLLLEGSGCGNETDLLLFEVRPAAPQAMHPAPDPWRK